MSDRQPLISVIVPIYKVEDYLDECVESLVGQTHKNLEIILVDDGSPDGCPAKCDDWAQKDPRIKVVHKKNGGLSSARNAGLEVATGDYIGYIDSDDYVATDMYEKLLAGFADRDNVGITCCMVMAFDEKGQYPYRNGWTISEATFTPPGRFYLDILKTRICHTAWSKLYRRDLIDGVRFKDGRNNEDTLYLFELSKKMENQGIGMLTIPYFLYFYRMREGSICNSTGTPLALDMMKNHEEMMDYFRNNGDKRDYDVEIERARTLVFFCMNMIYNKYWRNKYFSTYFPLMQSLDTKLVKKAFANDKKMYWHFRCYKSFPNLYTAVKRLKGNTSKTKH